MTKSNPYTFIVLRYVHDVSAAEFLNVGVALHCPQQEYLRIKTRHTSGRISKVFPGASTGHLKKLLKVVSSNFDRLADQGLSLCKVDFRTIGDIASLAYPVDDSSLQWSPVGSGITSDAERTLQELFSRFVSRYDEVHEKGRSDQEVWQEFSKELEKRNVLGRFQEKTFRGEVDAVKFKRSWKNGQWHCVEPLSLDLLDPENIKDKARRWYGQVGLVRKGNPEQFKLYFLVGKPRHSSVLEAYEAATEILRSIPDGCEIFTESEAAIVSDRIAREMEAHDRSDRAS